LRGKLATYGGKQKGMPATAEKLTETDATNFADRTPASLAQKSFVG
jgi:hypothetical protein